MSGIQNIGIIGAGNMGTYLATEFRTNKFGVQLFTRKKSTGTFPLQQLYEQPDIFDLLLLCVNDDSIEEVSENLPETSALVAHVSGATPLEMLASKHLRRAVFYPLMSIKNANNAEIGKIPFCLETSSVPDIRLLADFVTGNGAHWFAVNSEERKHLHLAAVLAHNFTNHLVYKAEQLMQEVELDFRILLPLLENSFSRLYQESPKDLQTGPAIRKDQTTIQKHLELIKDPITADIYTLLTKSIQNTYDQKL